MERGKSVVFDIGPDDETDPTQPVIPRRPEIVHGLRNLIQNAVDFAETTVQIDIHWNKSDIAVRISDDGPGFPPSVIGRIGDPYVRRRRANEEKAQRPGYQGMGLGLFIAKTLLERSGAKLSFGNSRRHGHARWTGHATGGAMVTLTWSRNLMPKLDEIRAKGVGENVPHQP